MADDLELARPYLSPPPHGIWHWAEDAEVIAWRDGVTILFRAELLQILRRLAPQGLPPLGAIVFLLAACRHSWPEASQRVASLAGQVASVTRRGFPGWLPDVMSSLDRVAALPGDLLNSTEAKATLAEVVFEQAPGRTSPVVTQAVLRVMSAGLPNEMVERPELLTESGLLSELQCLHVGLERVDAATLELRRRTGLDDLVEPAELELESAEKARRLIASLQYDPELGGVARIARHLMAAVHLPRSVSDPEDLPVGGVSDITNRGALDRLLLSELAHDELTLAVRIALREALYLRREAPPRSPPQHRAVLVDVGLRMWGVPRVFAAGAALALAAGGNRQVLVDTFQSQGKSAVAVDLSSREGLTKHLEALQPDAHPGAALPAFLTAASAEVMPREVLLVTGADVAADPDFQKALTGWDAPAVYLATVDREGQFQLLLRRGRGTRVICQARLDLDEILRPRSKRHVPLIDDHDASEIPAICRAESFPLLLPHPIDPERMWPADGQGVLAVTRDRRLMYWERGGQAARQLTDKLPFAGIVLWSKKFPGNRPVYAIIARSSNGPFCLVKAHPERGEFDTVMLEVEPRGLRLFCEYQGTLFAAYGQGPRSSVATHVDAIDTLSGKRLGTCSRMRQAYVRLAHAHGRLFPWSMGRWYALSWDGQKICWEEVINERQNEQQLTDTITGLRVPLKPGTTVVMPDNYEGFLGITPQGEIYRSQEDRYCRILPATGSHYTVFASAMDGQVLLLGATGEPRAAWRIDLPEGKATRLARSEKTAPMLLHPQLNLTVWSQSLPWHFQEIFGGDTSLTLISHKGHTWRLELDEPGKRLWMRRGKGDDTLTGIPCTLKNVARPPDTGYELRLAQWQDGSRAWIDSRGLLHLRSSDARLPELTLVLHDKHVSGWCSDGRVFGSKYFLGGPETATAAEIVRGVLNPFLARLR